MKGYAHLALVLVLLQAGSTLLAMLGQLLVMGQPWYLPVPLLHAALLVVAGTAIRRRWAAIILIVTESLSLLGFWVSVAVGTLPWLVYPVTLAGLLTEVVLPAAVLSLAVRSFASSRAVSA